MEERLQAALTSASMALTESRALKDVEAVNRVLQLAAKSWEENAVVQGLYSEHSTVMQAKKVSMYSSKLLDAMQAYEEDDKLDPLVETWNECSEYIDGSVRAELGGFVKLLLSQLVAVLKQDEDIAERAVFQQRYEFFKLLNEVLYLVAWGWVGFHMC